MIIHKSPGIDVQISSQAVGLWRDENRVVDITPVSKAERLAIEIRLGCAGAGLIVIAGLMFLKLWGLA